MGSNTCRDRFCARFAARPNRRRAASSSFAILAVLVLTFLGLAARSQASTLSTGRWRAEIRNGRIVSLVNCLTGENLVRPGAGGLSAGLQRLGEELDAERADRRSERRGAGWLEQTAIWLDSSGAARAKLSTRFEIDRRTGDLLVTQMGSAPAGGLYGAAWALGEVRAPVEALVPGNSGQRFALSTRGGRRLFSYGHRVFDYPTGWEAAFALVQGRRGGVIVRAQDPEYRYKALTVDQAGGAIRLRFESRNEAPFQKLESIVSSRWRLTAYRGDWRSGAAIYAAWLRARDRLVPFADRKPAWARGIQFVVTMGMDIPTLRLLATKCTPAQTLLYIPNWRASGYDRNYPDYTAVPEFGPFVREAHRLGFRVMVHTDYFGCDPLNPAYAGLKQYQLRDPISGELQWWDWQRADPPIKFAYIDPACRAWRSLFVSRMVDVYRRYRIDAIHLDVSLVMINDGIGRVDGMNMIQGSLALHRELRRALPEVALGGEGLDEITCRYEQFAQRHLSGMDAVDGTWSDGLIAMSHAVSSAIVVPYTRLYGYLGMSNPDTGDLYTAWRRGYEHFGVIPTLCWPDVRQLTSPSPRAAQLLSEARLFQAKQPFPDFKTTWKPGDIFVWRMSDGRGLFYRRDNGVVFGIRERNGGERALSRRIEDVEEARIPGSVQSWPAYDDESLLGLDPHRSYAWSPTARDMSAMHIAALPKGLHITQYGIHKQFARFRFEDTRSTVRLWEFEGKSSGGVRLADGTVRRFEGLAFEDEPTGGNCHPDESGFFIHPPWRGAADMARPRPGGSRHVTFVDFTVQLPNRPQIVFRCGVRLDPNAAGKSDGVTFRAIARSGGERISAERHNATAQLQPLTLDLSGLRGRVVSLRLEADPGPTGNPGFDWGRIDQPVIISPEPSPSATGTVDIVHAERSRRGAGAGEAPIARYFTPVCDAEGPLRRITMALPNTLILPLAAPAEAQAPYDLLRAPFLSSVVLADGLERAAFSFYGGAPGEATCNGQTRHAMHLHPPAFGRSMADFWLRLPSEPLELVTAAGIRDGAKSAGVTFEVEVNGAPLFHRALLPGDGWNPVEIDLSRWRGKPVLLTLISQAEGDNAYDWAVWAEPELVAKKAR
jgi:hypothetical protein